jgi:WD40 repeat protein
VLRRRALIKLIPADAPVSYGRGHSDGRLIVSGGGHGIRTTEASRLGDHVRIWDAATGNSIGTPLAGHTSLVLAVAVSPDGTRIASASADHTIRLWDVKSGRPIGGPLGGHEEPVTTVAFSPDGSRLVSGSADKTIRFRDATTGQPIGTPLDAHGAGVETAAFNADGSRLMTGGYRPSLRLWDPSTRQPFARWRIRTFGVATVSTEPGRSQVAVARWYR